ncbi:MAG: hypothetical protein AB1646_20365 [Thermodesulfobacteriota bacterium]
MLTRLAIELLILLMCVSAFPVAILMAVHLDGTMSPVLAVLVRGMFSGGAGPWGTSLWLWLKLLAPYLAVQVVRLGLWATGRSLHRSWGFFAGFLFFAAMGGVLVWKSMDLLYFMYALDDIPAQFAQFVHMEGWDLLVGTGSMLMAFYSLSIFLHLRRTATAASNG